VALWTWPLATGGHAPLAHPAHHNHNATHTTTTRAQFKLDGAKRKTPEVSSQGDIKFSYGNRFQFDHVAVMGPELTVRALGGWRRWAAAWGSCACTGRTGRAVLGPPTRAPSPPPPAALPAPQVEIMEVGGAIAAMGQKQSLGTVSIEVNTIRNSYDKSSTLGKHILGYSRRLHTLENGDGALLDLELQFVPHF
jgi:hypothetical protein